MDDHAANKPPRERSLLPRVSAIKSIVTRRRDRSEEPTPSDTRAALQHARREAAGPVGDQRILDAYVGALETLHPNVRFALRLGASTTDLTNPAQAATHRLDPDSREVLCITEAGLVRSGLDPSTVVLTGVELTRTYRPILEPARPEELAYADGMDVPVQRGSEVIGVLSAEFDGRDSPPACLDTTLAMAAVQLSASIEAASLRRESSHLRDYLEKLLEHANIPVLVVGRDRGIRVMSRAFRRITGIELERLQSKDLLQLAPQTERVSLLSAFVRVLRGQNVPPFEVQLPNVDGGSARLSFKLAPVLDSEGQVAGVIAIGRDRTEVRALEGQVIHAEKLATLGQLAAGIVHEINNPLTSISVYGEYLLGKLSKGDTEPSDVKRVERILRSADRIMSFTRNLLTYARPSKEEAREVSISEILDEAIEFCEHLAREANVTIIPDYADDLPRLHAVPGQLHQVFVNLITNACNAVGDQGGVLSIQTRALSSGRIQVIFEDNGVGIPRSQLQQVFEPFFSTRRKGKGTGLGLSIVKNIVEQHRGEIEIESTVGERTKVTISLPLMTS